MFEAKIEKILEHIYKLAFTEGDMLLKSMIDQFYAIRSDAKTKEGVPLRQILLEAQQTIIESDPYNYQGLIFLGFAFYELKLFEKTHKCESKALKILESRGATDSNWGQIAEFLMKSVESLLDSNVLLDYFDVSISNIKKKMGDEIGATFLCADCGTYNVPNSRFCLNCGKKFTKKDKKK